ncbi:MAG: class I SAM-dependent methyltransferase [Hyphomicrobiales bacterium]|nr:methyltransferase domain-containing protein [Hyphomicrobiales bacterium]MDE2016821.1 class I SAM-dependent methyltransferase [Hyphomicrobiales bacterium]
MDGTKTRKCRSCSATLDDVFVDLGETPLANSFLTEDEASSGRERRYPLVARVCRRCFLVQVDDPVRPDDIFSDYAYFSSTSSSWVEHARAYALEARRRFGLGDRSLVVEVAANDGYLLQHFAHLGVRTLGIEPAANVAEAARAKGIPVEVAFFGAETAGRLARGGASADLMVANNVLAHVPDIRDFLAGFPVLLAPGGVATFEFPHLLNLIREVQFDTIYHEHFSYLSLLAVERAFADAGLVAFDVEELPTHGGSLRLFAQRAGGGRPEGAKLGALRERERAAGLDRLDGYRGFAPRVEAVKAGFRSFLSRARAEGRTVAAYGAAAKGNTFLNVCGIGRDDLVCAFDRSPAKQGKLTPGSHLPILAPERIEEIRPDYLLVLPWNLIDEIRGELGSIAAWGGRLVTAVPDVRTWPP